MSVLAFGPFSYSVEGSAIPREWKVFSAERAAHTRAVLIEPGRSLDAEPPTFETAVCTCRRSAETDRVVAREAFAPEMVLTSAFSNLLAIDAPLRGMVVVHAAAVNVGDRVALLVARPGVGKTTRAVAVGDAAFAYCSALVHVVPPYRVWALPFSGGGDPPIRDVRPRTLAAIAAVHRASSVSIERRTGADATVPVVSAVPAVLEPVAHRKAVELALELAARVPVVSLGSPPDASYLAPLHRWLEGLART